VRLIDKTIKLDSRSDEVNIYPLGDTHLGNRSCAESLLKKTTQKIGTEKYSYWIGGGDYLDAIKPQDSKRFDMDIFPDWMLEGDAITTREKLNDILYQQYDRCCGLLTPIASKCLGLIEGNHEYSVRKFYNTNVQNGLCNSLKTEDLTDEAIIRLKFMYGKTSKVVKLYICHGHGGGRTAGAEPNHLFRMLSEWEDCDICLRGHSHTFHIIPPKPVLYLPNKGKLPDELLLKYRWAANWGCWMLSHKTGPSSYVSRACYPARPMLTCKVVIRPFARIFRGRKEHTSVKIEIRAITL